MKSLTIRIATAALLTASLTFIGCEKPDNGEGIQEEPRTNYFAYDGYSFDINSVVRYDDGSNHVELWLSPESNLDNTAAIEKSGDYVVLRTHGSYLGNRDRFDAQTSKESYIRFADKEFSYGDKGIAYIEASITDQVLTLDFLAQNMYTKANAAPSAILSGTYTGSFSVETEQPYSNEWGLGRKRTSLTGATFTLREDGGDSSISLFDDSGRNAVTLTLSPTEIGKQLNDLTGITLTYNDGTAFPLKGASGTVKTSIDASTITVSINVSKDETQLRAQYTGTYEPILVKTNRYIFEYDGTSQFEGTHEIVKLMTQTKANTTTFYFSHSEGYDLGSDINSTHMPILSIPSDVINAGKKSFNELSGWEFAFDVMQVWPYVDPYKPHPSYSDWIEVSYVDGIYEINIELSSQATGMEGYGSRIDIYFKGEARN